jgi:nitrilase
MISTPKVEENLAAAGALVAQAAGEGAELVVLPEFFCIFGLRDGDKVAAREKDGAGPIQDFLAATAKRHGVWLVGGSVPLESGDPAKVRNSCLVYDSAGQRVARYDKIHLFGFEMGQERYTEERTIEPGTQVCTVESPYGKLGISVCYDLRFPELYRHLSAAGAQLLIVPSAFTSPTGRAHWEALLRARAIENLCYVLAPAQSGFHPGGRETYGDSMIVDFWGRILQRVPRGTGCAVADIDLSLQSGVRESFPALVHRAFAQGTSAHE